MQPGRAIKIIFTLLLLIRITAGQDLLLHTFSTKDGLPSPYIYGTYEDKFGYLWITSPNGLSRYDGSRFVNYGYAEGLNNVSIGPLLMDSKQGLWIGAKNSIGRLIANHFTSFPLSDSATKFYVSGLYELKDGAILASTTTGIYRFSGNHWEKKKYYPGYDNHGCRKLVENADGLYIDYGDLLVNLNKDNHYILIGQKQNTEYFYNNIQDFNGIIYASTMNGICRVEKDRLVPVSGEAGTLEGLYSMYIDSKHRWWIANRTGGLRMKAPADTSSFRTIYVHPRINLITSINEDKDGNIWVGDYEGLVKITDQVFESYNSENIGSGNLLRNIIQVPGQQLWFNDGTPTRYFFSNGVFQKKPMQAGRDPQLLSEELIIDHVCKDAQENLWFNGRGFRLFQLKENRLFDMAASYNGLSDEVFDVVYDHSRKRIVAAIGSLKSPCYYEQEQFHPIQFKNRVDIQGNIRKLHQCTNGQILFSTDLGRLYAIDAQDNCREVWRNNINSQAANFEDDPSGDLWVQYTGIGLIRLRWYQNMLKEVEELNKQNSLPNDFFIGISFDDHGRLWVGSLAGITVLEKDNHDHYSVLRNFGLSELNGQISEASRLNRDDQGYIWCSFPDKLIRFTPSKVLANPVKSPGIKIEEIQLDLKPTKWKVNADSVNEIFGIPTSLKLSYRDNSIGIYYHAISSSGLDGVNYCYRLKGLSDAWSAPTTNDFVSFVKLPASRYRFEVKAKLPGSAWSIPAAFEFTIRKPYWEEWWFRILVTACLAGMIIYVFRYRINQVRSRTEMQHQLSELEMKALKAQINPHFIYNSLNSIQSLVANNRANEASKYISQFANLLRQVLDQSDTNLIPIEREIKTIRLYLSLETLRLGFEPLFETSIPEYIDPEKECVPPLILQPFIENALWHGFSGKEGDKKITVSFSIQEAWLICSIYDNGIGRKSASSHQNQSQSIHKAKGIEITRKRLIEFNNDGKDPVLFTDLVDDSSNSTGTLVTLRIRQSKQP